MKQIELSQADQLEAGELSTIDGQPSGRAKTTGQAAKKEQQPSETPSPKSIVHEASEQSFPASDPPAWTGSELGGRERKVGE